MTAELTYDLIETGGNPNYVQYVAENAVIPPPRTGSWQCFEVDAAGEVIPGFSDGLNGGVTVHLGTRVRCIAVNYTQELTLIKEVVNDDGGTATPDDWDLTATPQSPPPGVIAQTVPGSFAGVTINIRPGVNHTITETSVPGYAAGPLECVVNPDTTQPRNTWNWQPVTFMRSAPPHPDIVVEHTYCRFINNDEPVRIVVEKEVPFPVPDTGVFDLSVNGTTVATGGDGTSNAGSPAPVDAGSTVTVAEAGVAPTSLANYASTLACNGGVTVTPTPGAPAGTSGSFTVPPTALGTTITCTFTNARRSAVLSLGKVWVDGLVGDSASLSIDGVNDDSDVDVVGGPVGVSSVTVLAGERVVLAEVFDGVGSYDTDLSCSAPGLGYVDGALSGTFTVPAVPVAVTCTFTNTRRRATLTLRKEWVDGAAGDEAVLSIDGVNDGSATAVASGVAGSEISAAQASAVVLSGEVVSLSEVLGAGNTGGYATVLACGGVAVPLSGSDGFVHGAGDPGDVTCTFTNTRTRATVTLQKAWVDAVAGDTADLMVTSSVGSDSQEATAPAPAATAAQVEVLSGSSVALAETLTSSADYETDLGCVGNDGALTYTAGEVVGVVGGDGHRRRDHDLVHVHQPGVAGHDRDRQERRRGRRDVRVHRRLVGSAGVLDHDEGGTGSLTFTGVLAGSYELAEVDPTPEFDGTDWCVSIPTTARRRRRR